MQPFIIFELRSLIDLLQSIQCCKSDTLEFVDSTFDKDPAAIETLCCRNKITLGNFHKASTIAEFNSVSESIFDMCEYDNVVCVDEDTLDIEPVEMAAIESILVKGEGSSSMDVYEQPSNDPLTITATNELSPSPQVDRVDNKIINDALHTYVGDKKNGPIKYPDVLFCEFCGKSFRGQNRGYKFSYHRNRVHTRNLTFNCNQCDKVFFGERELKAHSWCHETPNNVCHICGKTWTSRYELDRHVLVHRTDKRFVCSFCKKEFKRKDHLNVHERMHSGNFPFICSNCGSGFAQKTQLKLHYKRCPFRVQEKDLG